ncbi:MAG: hydroxymethylbilane synthase [Planctomycetota bacterium]
MVRIATRRSALALWQAEHVAARLRDLHADLHVELVPLSTRGDEILDRSLADIGGKGLFLKELEVAMLDGRAEMAVHSAKDIPTELDPPFVLAAILERADPFDALVSRNGNGLDALPLGARVGTSSLRRQLQLIARRPDLVAVDLRGNVGSRLAKVDTGEIDAAILACAGLERLGFGARIAERLVAPDWLPAAAQGALAIECRSDAADIAALVAPLAHASTMLCVTAERTITRALEGSCQVPIAAYAELAGNTMHLTGWVGSQRTGQSLRATAQTSVLSHRDAEALGAQVAQALLSSGARALLDDQSTPLQFR